MTIQGYCCGLNRSALNYDEAFLTLQSNYDKLTYLYTLSGDCYKCPYTKIKALHPQSVNVPLIEIIKINVASALKFKILEKNVGPYALENETSICDFQKSNLQEYASYNFTLQGNGSCEFVPDYTPRGYGVEIYLLLLAVVAIWWFNRWLPILWCSFSCWKTQETQAATIAGSEAALTSTASSSMTVSESPDRSSPVIRPTKLRMRSLDTFRGMAIVLMIFVNSGGGGYAWIEHAPWNGLHLADVVFPSFLWIMGVCIPMSVRSQLNRGCSKFTICKRIAWRSLKLFLIGVCLNSIYGPLLEDLRIMGVLQRFGISYLACGICYTIFVKPTAQEVRPENPWKRAIYDLILFKGELLVILVLIGIYLGVTFGVAAPGCPKGYLGPGGLHDNGAYQNCTGGIARQVDLVILGPKHMYQHSTAKAVYKALNFDPEGIFGCLTTIVQVFLGVFAGITLHVHKEPSKRLKRWLLWSVVFGVLAGILCGFSINKGAIPINKNLWSLSFVFLTTCMDFLILSLLYLIIDVFQLWDGFPFTEAGRNAIILYVGHTVAHKMLPWHWRVGNMNTHFVLLMESLWNTTIWIYIAWYLDKIKFYYSV